MKKTFKQSINPNATEPSLFSIFNVYFILLTLVILSLAFYAMNTSYTYVDSNGVSGTSQKCNTQKMTCTIGQTTFAVNEITVQRPK